MSQHWQHSIAGKRNVCAAYTDQRYSCGRNQRLHGSANPLDFDHRQLALEGIVAGLTKSTSRSGHKDMTFLLRSPVGCGGVIVYAQGPATLSNGDHLQVEGIFETEHRRDGSTFHNEMLATKITTLPR
jgi:hypothetical protein